VPHAAAWDESLRPAAYACYSQRVEALRRALADDPRIAYALLFGSSARGAAHAGSDLDIAVGLQSRIDPLELGELVSRLEHATGRSVDLLVLDEAPPSIAYRVFREGRVIVENDHRALVECQARAILEYLDFRPLEELAARGVLMAVAHGR
jgi:uncharacterized protein